ncbi:hypothetical protein BDW02DRAFT_575157 [Decorospora gaudefroyi]|uniref:Uncharacterized protein n=1 Tax=Decorospora gaudefroyi TaxID=184978 RepID=A0A6A5JXN1_9PLEO|nr:hypothetical protein BDW02DRAFT_575157 [Decorospora gaudefroyi]
MASFYFWLTFTAALCTARSIERAIPGGSQYDQVRFMDCDNSGNVVGYYGKPPQGNDAPQTTFASWAKGGVFSTKNWDALCGRQPWVRGTSTIECGLRNFGWNEPFKTYIGNITYDGEGFNCFKDDGHAVHTDPHYGQCYSSIYCTHDSATVVRIAASSDTVFVGEHSEGQNLKKPPRTDGKAAVAEILGNITSRISEDGLGCDPAPIHIRYGCTMSVSECASTDSDTMDKMVQLLLGIYASNDELFSVNDQDDTTRPNRGGAVRGYTRGVKMPKSYTMSVKNQAPPKGDGSLNLGQESSLRAKMMATINCPAQANDKSLCTALGALTTFGAGVGGAAGLFFAGLAGAVILGCA